MPQAESRGPRCIPETSGPRRAPDRVAAKAGEQRVAPEQKATFGEAPAARRNEVRGPRCRWPSGRGLVGEGHAGPGGRGQGQAAPGGGPTGAPPPGRPQPSGRLVGERAHRTRVAPPPAPWSPWPAGAKRRAPAACSPEGRRRSSARGLRTLRAPATLLGRPAASRVPRPARRARSSSAQLHGSGPQQSSWRVRKRVGALG